jgi:hypothetical protein
MTFASAVVIASAARLKVVRDEGHGDNHTAGTPEITLLE